MLNAPWGFTRQRYVVLLAAKGPGTERPGRVWRGRDNDYMLTPEGLIHTVTSITMWLEEQKLLEEGKPRALGGVFLRPSRRGLELLEQKLHPQRMEDER